jgi:hypothetical protein
MWVVDGLLTTFDGNIYCWHVARAVIGNLTQLMGIVSDLKMLVINQNSHVMMNLDVDVQQTPLVCLFFCVNSCN